MSKSKMIEPGKWHIEFDENGRRSEYVYEESACRLLGYASRNEYVSYLDSWSDMIHPDDRDRVTKHIADVEKKHPEGMDYDIEYRIITKNGYHLLHDYGHVMRREDGSPIRIDGVAFDMQDIVEKDNAVNLALKQGKQLETQQAQLAEFLAFANFFFSTFVSAYYIDLDDYSYRIYKRTDELNQKYPYNEDFFSNLQDYINLDVHPSDRAELTRILSPENMRSVLSTANEYSHFYKDISDGVEKIYKVQVLKGTDGHHVALGFADQTKEFTEQQKHLLGAIPLSPDVLTKANIGLWSFELDEDKPPRMYADEAMLHLIGLEHQIEPEDTYHAWYDHIDPASYELVNNAVEKMISGEHAEVQYPWHHPNGETWIVRCGGVRNFEYTKGIRIEGTHQDVTRVLHLDEEMKRREKESLFNYFIQSYESAYFVNLADDSFDILHMSDSLSAAFNHSSRSREDMMAFIDKHIHPDDKDLIMRMTDKAYVRGRLKNEDSISFTVREIYDGNEKTMRGQIISGSDDDHIAVGFMDITAESLEQQQRLLGAIPLSADILTKANIGLWSFELDEGCAPRMYADAAMLGLLGLDHQIPPEDAYHAWYDHIDDASYDLVNDAVEKMISGEHAEVQYPWHHPDGQTWIVRCGGVRNFGYTKGIRIEGTHQNVTALLHYDEEQRKREEQQRKDELARVKAEASNKAKTEFLFNMSHDIRTPMNAILGYTDIATNHIDEANRVSDCLKKIKTSGGHLLGLINDILEMSRIEAGKMEIVPLPLNVYEVSNRIIYMNQTLAIAKEISFIANIKELNNQYIYADELHTNQVIMNLISNAIKYTNPGGTVHYSFEQIGAPVNGIAKYRITVKDNGIGMSSEFQQHLFESFSREKSTTVSQQEGTGLGLAIVKKIVDLMDGTISVKSKLGEGSTFIVELPFKVMDDEAIQAFNASQNNASSVSADITFEGQKILLVEDNMMNREIATEILEEAGFVVDAAEDGAIAVKKVTQRGVNYYDYILMDIQMPVMNGYEATAEIRKIPGSAKIPIIALSANAFKEDIDKSLTVGMNAHVSKPINIQKLFETFKAVKKSQ